MKSNRQYTRPQSQRFYDEVPVGQEVDLLLDENNPQIPDGYVLMDGSTVNDSESPLNGQTLPDRNEPKVKQISANYTIQEYDAETFYVDASSNNIQVTLPILSGNLGRQIIIRAAENTGSNTLSIAPAGTDTIVGLSSVTLTSQGDFWTFEAGPSRWELVAGYESVDDAPRIGRKYYDGKAVITSEELNKVVSVDIPSGNVFVSNTIAAEPYGIDFANVWYVNISNVSARTGVTCWVVTDDTDVATPSFWPSYRMADSISSINTMDIRKIVIGAWY